ncbi:MAG: methyltransferase domain-containing protein [Parvularculaceae bacterium]
MTKDVTQRSGAFYADAAKAHVRARKDGRSATTLDCGYRENELASAPDEAVAASFGCGDPLAFSGVRRGETVLDLGCGAGLDLIIAGEKAGAEGRVIGVDASPDMLALAAANIARAGMTGRIDLREGAIENLPVEDGSVDWVVSNCVVNLSPDKAQVFREVFRVLKPGGAALIADLVAENLPQWATMHGDLYSACVSGAVSENAYLDFARQAGLADIRIVDRMTYDESMVRVMIAEALPAALDEIAARLDMTKDALLDMAARDPAGRIASIKLYASRP